MTTQTGWGGGRLRRFGCSHFLSILEVPRLYIAAALDAFYFLVSQLILKKIAQSKADRIDEYR
jgi:hypothetical protein